MTSGRKLENVVADAKLKKGRKLATKDSSIDISKERIVTKNLKLRHMRFRSAF